ncbi:DUF2284 domain-containing protein [Paraclostridium sordellii]|uniref:DUF2284 domain-containing protein n=1 Tax=Paraclostridium sordellii TaxID=1505 RepID=UPI0005E2963A|nr:DUF2284 domain-containing protein [Paeniclostridium sordellii]CEO08506.1 Predicted metal-binding protein [[Clostridium] sordellii] [Paeniclostridium sordellii]CEP87232.1 Predicted metal-binding protein [[Clostridium] sordellii] [Paeniclostridium sordellii]CEP99087.1 Predicted metal-binding protein [[Clostridium] sordellii] [Paeniclostridium sordellii]
MSNIFNFNFIHKTPSSDIVINLKAVTCSVTDLCGFEDKPLFNKLCKVGCPNFEKKWSCPPYSPRFTSYSKNYKYALVILMYCNLDQFNYTKTEYMKIKASNSILKTRMDKLMRFLENELDGLMVSNGSCRLCKPCNCKKSLPCKKPNLKRYSMEALGLDVGNISLDIFNHKLLWYKDKIAPKYSTVISCLLLNNIESNKDIYTYLKGGNTI